MEVRIFKPAKTAMQSGWGKAKDWILEFEPSDAPTPDPLIGWVGSSDTNKQVRLYFATKDEAIAYAKKRGFSYTIQEEKTRTVKPKSYAANFASDRMYPWTH
ncbi:ETC complex I subunit [Aestuariispira ectoiniformans]|uniref:ETC complex I subunit n=1 Tax=Aestuariispira ectoiniformans TaxID=2775080 RepID=UPI00223BF280|nr:ETC complex I subunit [Aestuariispira ectoiniformans]